MVKRFTLILFILTISAFAYNKETRQGFFWKVKSKKATVYLLGSIHVGNKSMYPLPEKIESAYNRSDVVVTETPFSEESNVNVLKKLTYPNNETIQDHLSEKTYKRLKVFMEKEGLPLLMLKRFKVWYIAFLTQYGAFQKIGYSLQWGIDYYFVQKALKDKKKMQSIESVLDIDALFSSFSDEINEKLLNYFLDDTKEIKKTITDLYTYWNKSDLDGLEKYIGKYINKEKELIPVFEKLIYARNDKMIKKIKSYLKTDKTYFVIIGSGHYSGERGIIQKLQEEGITVTKE